MRVKKNSPKIELNSETKCCQKECLKRFSTAHLYGLREKFEGLYYDEQNIYLHALIGRQETKKSVGASSSAKSNTFSIRKEGWPSTGRRVFVHLYILSS